MKDIKSRLRHTLAEKQKAPKPKKETKTKKALEDIDDKINEVFVELKKAFNHFQAQRAEVLVKTRAASKTKKGKEEKRNSSGTDMQDEISRLQHQSENLLAHIEKIGDCISNLEPFYENVIVTNRPEAKESTRLIQESINKQYAWPADASVKEEFLKLLQRVLKHARQSPVLAATTVFFKGKLNNIAPDHLAESMPLLDLDEDYPNSGSDSDQTVAYYSY